MQGRTVILTSVNYRYGFNAQENDDEVKGQSNSMGAEYWEYDPRVGRRFNIDPKPKDYESPYASLGNNPVWFNDENGADTSKPIEGLVNKIDKALGGTAQNQEKVQMLRAGIKNQVEEIDRNTNLKALASDAMINSATTTEFKANLNLYTIYDNEIKEHSKSLIFLVNKLYGATNETHDIRKFNDFLNTELNLAIHGSNAALTAVSFLPTGGGTGLFTGLFARSAGERVFWSGGMEMAGQEAKNFALSRGLNTLETTVPGRTLSLVDRVFSGGRPSTFTYKIWGILSKNFAEGTKGAAHIFHNPNGIRIGSQWSKIEYPILQQKGIQLIFH